MLEEGQCKNSTMADMAEDWKSQQLSSIVVFPAPSAILT
jgi:hypothetical protein